MKSAQQSLKIVLLQLVNCPHFCSVKSNLMNKVIRKALSLGIFLLLSFQSLLHAQGWDKVYSGIGQEEIRALTATPDGGYLMAGTYNGNSQFLLIKIDADGNKQWERKDYPGAPLVGLAAAKVSRDSAFVLAGRVQGVGASGREGYLFRTDFSGNPLGAPVNLGVAGDDEINSMLELPSGDLLLAGYTTSADGNNTDVRVLKTTARGVILWNKTVGRANLSEKAVGLTLAPNGDIVVGGEREVNPGVSDAYVVRLNANGEVQWEQTYRPYASQLVRAIATAPNGDFVLAGRANTGAQPSGGGLLMQVSANGAAAPVWVESYPKADFTSIVADGQGYYIAGLDETNPLRPSLYVLRANAIGKAQWKTPVGRGALNYAYAVALSPDGGAAAAGYIVPQLSATEALPYLVKTDAEGRVFTSHVSGKVFFDRNRNCQFDANERGMEDWVVEVSGGNISTYISADAQGNFLLPVDTGSYTVKLYAANDYWRSCVSNYQVRVDALYDTVGLQIPVRTQTLCPRNEVHVSTPVLRRCATNTYTVRYANTGTVASTGTYVEVEVDPALLVTGSSTPWTKVQGNRYTFNVGTLNGAAGGSFTISTFLDCNTALGAARCVRAHIFPDTLCSAASDVAEIRAYATCVNDSVQLRVRNVGRARVSRALDHVIIEDIILRTVPNNPRPKIPALQPGEAFTVYTGPANGATYRVIAEQAPGYPGKSTPTAAIEGCKTAGGPDASTGYYTMFPEDDGDAFLSADCQETYTTDYSPAFLNRGHPKGYDEAHYVNPGTDLDYLIRFPIVGTGAPRQVIVRDTLSAFLDPATVQPGASSHPYDYQLYGGGIVQFTFNLPANSSAGEGYVEFRVAQKPNLSCGTKILNRAAIYFDYNAPAASNQTLHTVCDRDKSLKVRVISDTKTPDGAATNLKVYPNPFTDSAVFEVEGVSASHYQLEIFDVQGRVVFNQVYPHSTFRLSSDALPAGMLFYRLVADGRPVGTGKISVER